MPYAHEHILLRANGAFGNSNGLEKWSTNWRFGTTVGDTPLDIAKLQTFVNTAHSAFATFHSAAGVLTGNTTYFVEATGAKVGVDGKYSPSTQNTIHSVGSPIAGNGSLLQEWTAALVISLRTAIPRGRGSNGRIYWPATAATIDDATGRVGNAAVITRVAAAKTLVNALNTAAEVYFPGMRLQVMSKLGDGIGAPVTGIRSDNRVDNIERRENATAPTYFSATIP